VFSCFPNFVPHLADFPHRKLSHGETLEAIAKTQEAIRELKASIATIPEFQDALTDFFRYAIEDVEKELPKIMNDHKVNAAAASTIFLESDMMKGVGTLHEKAYANTESLLVTLLNIKNKNLEANTIDDLKAQIAASGITGPIVLVCPDLPDHLVSILLDERIIALGRQGGGIADHKTVVALERGIIPAIRCQRICSITETGQTMIVDTMREEIVIRPTPETIEKKDREAEALRLRRAHIEEIEHNLSTQRACMATTLDGQNIIIGQNIREAAEIDAHFAQSHVDVLGLLRLEGFFGEDSNHHVRRKAPDRDEVSHFIKRVLSSLHKVAQLTHDPIRAAIPRIRLVDIDEDKSLQYVGTAGIIGRALKNLGFGAFLDEERFGTLYGILCIELTGILCARGRKEVMLPNVFHFSDFARTLEVVDSILKDESNMEWADRARHETTFGIMAEHPLIIDDLERIVRDHRKQDYDQAEKWRLQELGFMSIGSNDLTKNTLNVPRDSELFDPLDPRVIENIRRILEYGKILGIPTSLCGEMGNDPLSSLILVGLGLRSVSLNPGAAGIIREMYRNVNTESCQKLVRSIAGSTTAEQVKQTARSYIKRKMRAREDGWEHLLPSREFIF